MQPKLMLDLAIRMTDGFMDVRPYKIITLWWTNIAIENGHAINGTIHYFYGHFQLLC